MEDFSRTSIINALIETYGYESYLEIGLSDPNQNFNKIKCKVKHSVDPFFTPPENNCSLKDVEDALTYKMTSDNFFSKVCFRKYDIIFIDGLHDEEQVDRDIENAMRFLNEGGIICVHDVLPQYEEYQRDEFNRIYIGNVVTNPTWLGTTWKSMAKLKGLYNFKCVDNLPYGESGLGLISYSRNIHHITNKCMMTFDDLVMENYSSLNPITVEDFERIYIRNEFNNPYNFDEL